jgi:hypothetical protein
VAELGAFGKHMRLWLFLFLSAFCLSGCVIVSMPFTSDRSPQFRAKLVDAATKQPVTGAQIWTEGNERKKTTTDSKGEFLLRPAKNFHFLFYANPSFAFGLPQGKRTDILVVNADGYAPMVLDFSSKATRKKYIDAAEYKGHYMTPFHHQYLTLKPLLLQRR